MNPIFRETYRVRISDAGADGKIKIRSLMQLLQEIATSHAEKLGVGFAALTPKKLGWALSKIVICVNKLPKWGDKIKISTWASSREKIVTYREFSCEDKDGDILFTARSQWILFDTQKRRIVRIEELGQWPHLENKFANSENFDDRLLKPDMPTGEIDCCARNDDIDLNGHVNNTVFTTWAFEAIPDAFIKNKTPSKIRINFMEEVAPHSKVKSLFQSVGDKTLHSILKEGDGRECARVNILWNSILS